MRDWRVGDASYGGRGRDVCHGFVRGAKPLQFQLFIAFTLSAAR
jgi:hypothetical protein